MLLLHLSHRIMDRESYFSLMKRVKTQSTFIVLALTLLWLSNVSAATINATSCSQAHVQEKINSASPGDTVVVPAGNCTWSSGVSIPNGKKITLQGAGMDSTVITISGRAIEHYQEAESRITGFGFIGGHVKVDGDGWRVDHCKFYYASSFHNAVWVFGQRENHHPTGLVDNCTFFNGRVLVQAWGGLMANALWAQPLNLGSGNNVVYVEDCTFTSTVLSNAVDGHYGGRYVFRYNTINDTCIDAHSIKGDSRASRKWEIYNNTINQISRDMWVPMMLRAGTGVVFNNKVTGTWANPNISLDNPRSCDIWDECGRCNGSSPWDGNNETDEPDETGYPCRDQIGRSTDQWLWTDKNPYPPQAHEPAYAWNNKHGANDVVFFQHGCAESRAHIQPGRDYFNNVQKPGYTPYTYPHPLRQAEPIGELQAPKNLRIVASQEELSLSVTTSGNGSVDVVPNQDTYSFGQQVTLTAMADPGWVFSGWSGDLEGNDNPVTLTISGDHQVTATFADSAALAYSEGFEAYNDGDDPVDWLDTAANNNMSEDNSLFQLVDVGGEKVFGTASTLTNIYSHYTGSGSTVFSNYEYTGRMMMTESGGGIGVTLLSQYPVRDAYYRLRRYKSNSFHISPHGTSIFGITDTGVVPIANNWYHFRVRVQDTGIRTEILAKVWLDGDVEPIDWQVNAYDDTDNRLTSGTFGVWSYLIGSKYWDDLMVIPFSP